MSVPSFVKSTPFWIGTGTVAIGGVGIIIWQTSGSVGDSLSRSGSVESQRPITDIQSTGQIELSPAPSIPQNPNQNSTALPKFNTFQEYVIRPIALDDTILSASYASRPDVHGSNRFFSSFRLSGHGCFRTFFPTTRISVHDEYANNEQLLGTKTKEQLLVKATELSSSGNVQGCTTMDLAHMNDKFVFTSETIIRNDKVALALWTGIRRHENVVAPETDNMQLEIAQYLAFLEYDESRQQWFFKGGYSWTPLTMNVVVKSLTIKSPDGKSIDKTFKVTNDSGADTWKHEKYSGVWELSSSGEGDDFFKFNSDKYTFTWPNAVAPELILFSNELRGYKETDRFYELENSDLWYWRRHQNSSAAFTAMVIDAEDSIKEWYKPFENSKGSWKPLKEYCKSKSDGICKDNWYS